MSIPAITSDVDGNFVPGCTAVAYVIPASAFGGQYFGNSPISKERTQRLIGCAAGVFRRRSTRSPVDLKVCANPLSRLRGV